MMDNITKTDEAIMFAALMADSEGKDKKIDELTKRCDELMLKAYPPLSCVDKVYKAATDHVKGVDEQMKQTDALRIEAMSKIRREKACPESDPWKEILGNLKYFGPLDLSKVAEELDIKEGYTVEFKRWAGYIKVTFTSTEHGGSWTIPSKHIKDMDTLKALYKSFKELYA
jgi:hypothetical protein